MTNLNNDNLPKIETIYELKENHYESKTSQLSPAAQSKIIRKWGGNYLSEQAFAADISWPKGYGPTTIALLTPHYSFHLRIECHNWNGSGESVEVNEISEAWRQIDRLRDGLWQDSGWISNEVLNKCVELVMEAIGEGFNRPVNGYVRVQGRFWGGYEYKCKY